MQQQARDLALAMRDACLGVRISRLHRLVARRFDQSLRPMGLTLPQLEILAVLTLIGPARPAAVADALGVERSTISRNLAAMQHRGWVALDTAPSGRAVTAAVTEEGTRTLAAARAAWTDAQVAVAALVGASSAGTIDGWLDALAPSPAED
jgi:DNA-binding MarR family transcriptional regulator